MQVQSLAWKDPLEEEMVTHSSIIAGKFYGQRSLAGYKELNMTEHTCTQSNINIPYVMYIHQFLDFMTTFKSKLIMLGYYPKR